MMKWARFTLAEDDRVRDDDLFAFLMEQTQTVVIGGITVGSSVVVYDTRMRGVIHVINGRDKNGRLDGSCPTMKEVLACIPQEYRKEDHGLEEIGYGT